MSLLSPPIPTRPSFTPRQLQQADQGGFITDRQRTGRTKVETYPIDNVPADVPADRDDGIFVEAREQGEGYRVQVTIADVAAHVLPYSALAFAARERGFTQYRSYKTDTMFPKVLEDRMSLENALERLGLTISIELDAHFRPVHTEFLRTVTYARSTDYADARARMRTDPQYGLMERIASGIRGHFFGQQANHMVELSDGALRELNLGKEAMEAQKMVATFMVLANHAVDEPFLRSGMPFLHRNFQTAGHVVDPHAVTDKAFYGIESIGHADIRKSGPAGGYCHFTSPIRRAPDFFNAHMVHYIAEVMDKAETGLAALAPEVARPTLRHGLWARLIDIMRDLPDGADRGKGNKLQQVHLKRVLEEVLAQAGGTVPEGRVLFDLAQGMRGIKPPLTREDLRQAAKRVNQLVGIEMEEVKVERKNVEILNKGGEAAKLGSEALATKDVLAFTTTVRYAAQSGMISDALRDEMMKRIHSDRYETKDVFNIMVRSGAPKDPRWAEVKRAMAEAIKHRPDTVDTVLKMAVQPPSIIPAETLEIYEEYVPARARQGSAHENHDYICAAILSMTDRTDGSIIGSPYYSIGLDQRAARTHAKYTFLTRLAFGELVPMQQSFIPNLVYAELANSPKEKVLDEIAHRIGAKVTFERLPNDEGRPQARITVQGGQLEEPLTRVVVSRTEEGLHKLAANVILRMPAFHNATQHLTPLEVHEVLYAEERLAELAKTHGYKLTVKKPTEHHENGRIYFDAAVSLSKRGFKRTYHATGPNQSRAVSSASIQAMIENKWLSEKEAPAQSGYSKLGGWAMEVLNASHEQNQALRGY